MVVEAKGLGEDIDDRRWLNQVVSYAAVLGVSWAIVTDGDTWKILNAMAAVDMPDKLFRTIRISDGPTTETLNALQLISRDKVLGNELDSLWRIYSTYNRVRGSLYNLLQDGNPRVARIVLAAAKDANLSIRDIQDSLRRIEFQPMSESIPPISMKVEPGVTKKTSKTSSTGKKGPRFDFQKMGIAVGEKITHQKGGQVAVVNGPHQVLYKGKEYTLTRLTMILSKLSRSVQPSRYWTYGEKMLIEIYNETYKQR